MLSPGCTVMICLSPWRSTSTSHGRCRTERGGFFSPSPAPPPPPPPPPPPSPPPSPTPASNLREARLWRWPCPTLRLLQLLPVVVRQGDHGLGNATKARVSYGQRNRATAAQWTSDNGIVTLKELTRYWKPSSIDIAGRKTKGRPRGAPARHRRGVGEASGMWFGAGRWRLLETTYYIILHHTAIASTADVSRFGRLICRYSASHAA